MMSAFHWYQNFGYPAGYEKYLAHYMTTMGHAVA
jgi:hypothetical protein